MGVTHLLLVFIAIGIAAAERNVLPTKPELKFLTVWIAPQTHHSAMKHLRKIIRETGGPVFPPHVTLLPLLNSTYSDWADIQPMFRFFRLVAKKDFRIDLSTLPSEVVHKLCRVSIRMVAEWKKSHILYEKLFAAIKNQINDLDEKDRNRQMWLSLISPYEKLKSLRAKGFRPELKFLTVWIAPQTHHSAMKHLRKIIRETGGPVFPPHVTLLPLLNSTYSDWADIQPILSDISVAAGGPLDLQFYDMKVKDNFYQSIILEAVQTEDLMKLGQSVADQLGERYGAKDIPPYYPHTSLFYGTHTPEIVDRVTQMVDDYKLINTTIRFDRMDVWATPDTIEEWRYLGEFSSLKSVAHDVTGYWKLGEAKLRRVCYRLESLNRSSRIASTSYSCLPSITGAPLQIS
ncbi:hypothetical protein PROFUN_14046 [Planoprotostelium fungivorum]|uniref:Uncharacterized protein n=1 Tax=Planoprotostelium fungivorum TaxID=1890364 RepID=A0A2P6N221_9EUKA|nr:hypothetical protein PROFUN_14046 [Planoprotostelium fungivorum]